MDDLKSRRASRSELKREAIVETAMRHFAEHGYQGARVEDMATELGIAKGSVFQHFGSKAGLFFEAYKKAVLSLPAWLDAPKEVVERGEPRRRVRMAQVVRLHGRRNAPSI